MNKSAKVQFNPLQRCCRGCLSFCFWHPAKRAVPAESGEAALSEAAPGTLEIARPTDAVGLDPKVETTSPGNWVTTNVYENLVKLDTDLTFQPALAESWEQIEPDRWRFYLRQGVKFHDGTDFTADAVKFSIERIKNPDDPGRAASNLRPIIAVEIVDDYTVDIVTDGPYGPLLNIMSLVYATSVVSPAAVEQYGEDYSRNPVGTGPFRFVEWRTNDQIVIERFDDYWGEKAKLDRVVYRVIPEESARMLALDTGEVQMVMEPAPSQLDSYRDNPDFVIHEAPGVRVVYFGMMTTRAPLDDVRVRQAINYGFNRQSILDNVLEGVGYLPQAYISPPVFGFADVSEYFVYDPESAAALLDEAGWTDSDGDGIRDKDGEPLSLLHYSSRGALPERCRGCRGLPGGHARVGHRRQAGDPNGPRSSSSCASRTSRLTSSRWAGPPLPATPTTPGPIFAR